MHSRLISNTSYEHLKKFTSDLMMEIKASHHKLYEEKEMELYVMCNGYHFTDWLLEIAVNNMINEDGSNGAHWTVDQTTSVAQSLGVTFTTYNKFDFNYVMNMLYSDLYGSVSTSSTEYGKMAVKWLHDKDARDGKAFRYYWAISIK